MSDSNNISIHVIGKPGVGKTTVIDLINRMLRQHGFNTSVHQLGDEKMPPQSSETARINAILSKGLVVDINELPRRVPHADAAPASVFSPLKPAAVFGVPIVPIVQSLDHFAPYLKSEADPSDRERKYSVIKTKVADQVWVDSLPLKVGVPVSLLGLSEASGLVDEGLVDPTDVVEEPVVLDSIFLRLTPSAPLFQVKLTNSFGQYTLHPRVTSEESARLDRRSPENRRLATGARDVQVDIQNAKILVDLVNKQDIMGQPIPEFRLAKSMEIVLSLKARVSLDIGTCVVDPSEVIVNHVISDKEAGIYNTRMFELMTFEGYSLKANRGNPNRRRRPG